MPFLFSALTLRAVNEGAFKVIDEIRRQFKIPGLLEGEVQPEYAHVVDLTTQNALKSMIAPTMVTIIVPIILGFLLGPLPLAVYLISVTASSATLAGTQFNSGGALDNAKKGKGREKERHCGSLKRDFMVVKVQKHMPPW